MKAIRRLARLAPAAVLPLPLAGCAGWQSALDPHGPGAAALARLIWIFTGVSVVVWVLVMIALALAVGSRRALPPPGDPLAVDPGHDRRAALVITFAIGVTFIILLVLTGLSYSAQKTITEPQPDELSIRVTGYQWWWDVRYEDADASRTFTTANEIHVPVGRPVRLTLGATDVIHSFWVPNLTGKMDLVPGRQNELRLTADRAGVYRGQCSEYCGYQHAHMGILVVADPPEEFEAWRNRQIAAAEAPTDPLRQKGMELFLSRPCVVCHSVRGTPAGSRGGPDLTHVGSRRSIAAGMLPTNRGTLAAWIADPQGIKPGSKMPTMELQADEINALAAYLEGLK